MSGRKKAAKCPDGKRLQNVWTEKGCKRTEKDRKRRKK
jgi:hypothetical protein